MKTFKAAFVGTGMIGAGLAANAALNNFEITLFFSIIPSLKMFLYFPMAQKHFVSLNWHRQ